MSRRMILAAVRDLLPTESWAESYHILAGTDWRQFFFKMAALGYAFLTISYVPLLCYLLITRAIGDLGGPVNIIFSGLTALLISSIGLMLLTVLISYSAEAVIIESSIGKVVTWEDRIKAVFTTLFGLFMIAFGVYILATITTIPFQIRNTFPGSVIDFLILTIVATLQIGSVLTGVGFTFMWVASPGE